MKCPACGSENIQFGTNTSSGGYSVGKACCGYSLLGPIGFLCGALNSDTKTEEFWVCQRCGKKFSAQQANQAEQKMAQFKSEQKNVISESTQVTAESNKDDLSETQPTSEVIGYKIIYKETGKLLVAIRVTREITGYGLAEAKAAVESGVIKICKTKNEAEAIAGRFASEGILTEIIELKNED